MADKDIVNKSMFSNPIFVADLFNQIYFAGKSIINPSYITTGPTDLCLYKKTMKSISVTKREADVCKIYYRGKDFPIIALCIENQTVYDETMVSRIEEYNKLIKEDLLRQLVIRKEDPVLFLNVIITYSGSRKPYVNTDETGEEIFEFMNCGKDATIIKEFRPRKEYMDFASDLKVMFNCIRMNTKKEEKRLYKYVRENLETINNNPDIAYYLKELLHHKDIIVDPDKIKGIEESFMSFWRVLQEESKREERIAIVKAMKEKLTAEEIAELTKLPLEEVNEIIKKTE